MLPSLSIDNTCPTTPSVVGLEIKFSKTLKSSVLSIFVSSGAKETLKLTPENLTLPSGNCNSTIPFNTPQPLSSVNTKVNKSNLYL